MIIDSIDKFDNNMKNFIVQLLMNCSYIDIIIGSRN